MKPSLILTSCVFGNRTDDELRRHWREARARLGPICATPGHHDVQEMPREYASYLEDVAASYPRLSLTLRGVAPEWKLVEVDSLLSLQVHVLTDICDEYTPIARTYRRTRSLKELVETCLPKGVPNVPASVQKQRDAITITSKDLNLHLLGAVEGKGGQDARVSGFAWGSSFNLVQVARLNGRYYLKNGYHSAVALRRHGVTHIPCLLSELSSFADMEANGPGVFGEEYLESEEISPTVGHLASSMAYPVQLREPIRVISITVKENVVPIDI